MADHEQMRQDVRSPAPFSTWVGVVLLFGIFGAIALAIVGPSPRGDTYEETRAKKRTDALKTIRENDEKALTGYAWIDKNKGTVRLPIERAMELTVADLANKKPMAAYPIATATPETQPAAAASPAAGGKAPPPGAAKPSPAPSAAPQASGTPKVISVAGPESANRGQPAAATNPLPVKPATQPGAAASPAASPQPSTAVAPASPVPTGSASPAGSPLPARGASATPTPSPK